MQDIIKYVMAEAAKSNVEKRKVGCVIVANDKIVAKGHNIAGDPDIHAEAVACKELVAAADWGQIKNAGYQLTAYVSQPPCPACAELLAEHHITKIEVVEEFMKFDGDKLRFDLVDGEFMLWLYDRAKHLNTKSALAISKKQAKQALWSTDLSSCCCKLTTDILDVEERLARVLTFGARKYKPNNWRKNTDIGRYWAAAHRHLNAMLKDETHDPESGFEHLDHLWCNLMFIWVLDKDARDSGSNNTV